MKNITFLKINFFIALLVYLLVLFSGTCWAEQVYVLTPQEMTLLENRLATVKNNNSQLQSKVEKLNEQLRNLTQLSQTQETRLEILNNSYQELRKEEQKKLNKVRWQRNVAYIVSLGLAYALSKKA